MEDGGKKITVDGNEAMATHALSVFGDHGDVMSTRATGFAQDAADGLTGSCWWKRRRMLKMGGVFYEFLASREVPEGEPSVSQAAD